MTTTTCTTASRTSRRSTSPPGAVVILNHLCYAAGNSEPGYAEPTVSVARQRVDNYAAGFLKAGAAAVIADGHSGPSGYLRDLFTTSQPIETLWASQSRGNGNIVSFPSVRTPGATAFQDPQTPTSGFYRSLVVRAATSTDDGIATGRVGDTSADPASLSIPGNASVSTDAANLFGDPGLGSAPVRALSAGTRLRVIGQPGALSTDATALVQVQGLDDPTISGYLAVSDLVPRDSTPPVEREPWVFVLAQRRRRGGSGDPEWPVQRIGRLDTDHFQRLASAQRPDGQPAGRLESTGSGQSRAGRTHRHRVGGGCVANRRPDYHGTITVTNPSQPCAAPAPTTVHRSPPMATAIRTRWR